MWTFFNTPYGSYLKVFVVQIILLFLADGADIFAVDATDARTWLAAALTSTLPLVVNALNPKDLRYGRTDNI